MMGYGPCTVSTLKCGSVCTLEVRGVEQDLVSYMGQLELSNVLVEGWIIDTDRHSLLDGSCNVV